MTAKRINWFDVLSAYLIDEKMSVRNVARMFNLSYFTVRNKSQRNFWLRERNLMHHRARERMRLAMAYEEAKSEAIRKALAYS